MRADSAGTRPRAARSREAQARCWTMLPLAAGARLRRVEEFGEHAACVLRQIPVRSQPRMTPPRRCGEPVPPTCLPAAPANAGQPSGTSCCTPWPARPPSRPAGSHDRAGAARRWCEEVMTPGRPEILPPWPPHLRLAHAKGSWKSSSSGRNALFGDVYEQHHLRRRADGLGQNRAGRQHWRRNYDGEVVSCDSMQVYKRMDIGTAKPTSEEMQGIPHHMIDVAEPWEDFSVSRYCEMAAAHCGRYPFPGKNRRDRRRDRAVHGQSLIRRQRLRPLPRHRRRGNGWKRRRTPRAWKPCLRGSAP